MKRWLSAAARAAAAVAAALIALAVLRWEPVAASPPWDVRALPLFGPAVVLAGLAGLVGSARPRRVRWQPLGVALGLAVASLALVVAARPPAGLEGFVAGPSGDLGRLAPGPIVVDGPRLRAAGIDPVRRWAFRWDGPLRLPRNGTYRLWAHGRGHVRVLVDGRPLLEAEGEALEAGADLPAHAGPHRLEVVFTRTGPGPRLALGWTQPDGRGRPRGRSEVVPARHLGAPIPRAYWPAADALALAVAVLLGALVWVLPWDARRPLPARRAVTAAEIAGSLAGHTLLVALMSWPLFLDLAGSGVIDRPDGRLNAWILAWDVKALLQAPSRLFQAPIFHPLPDALAFSENLLVPAVLAAPGILLGGPVLGYNLVLISSLVVSGLGAQLLARRVTGARLAAFVGGAIFALGAHRWIRLAHLHAQMTLFLPFLLIALDRFRDRRTLGRAALVSLLLALQALSSIYLGALAALALTAAVACWAFADLRARDLARLFAALVLAALLLAPVARVYLRMRAFQGVEWTLADVATYATTLESYAAAGTRLYGPLTQRHLDPERVQDTLFPGLVPLLLGLAGLARAPARYRAVAVVGSAAAIALSLGPETALYRTLHEAIVLVRGVRALSRLSLFPVLALSVLTAFALAGRRRLALPALALALVEASNVPLRYAPAPEPSAAALWLRGGAEPVAFLPLGERDTEVMLDGLAHGRPLVNGDSGFVPRPYTRAMELFEAPLAEDGLRLLRAVSARFVVTSRPERLPVAAAAGRESVYEVTAGEPARVVEAATAAPTLWNAQGAVVDLGRPRLVDGVVFEVGEAAWVAEPSVELSLDGRTWATVAARASLADATLSLMRDPRRGRGEARFRPQVARFVRIAADVPARGLLLEVRSTETEQRDGRADAGRRRPGVDSAPP